MQKCNWFWKKILSLTNEEQLKVAHKAKVYYICGKRIL